MFIGSILCCIGIEEDVWELFLASFYGVPVCGAEEGSSAGERLPADRCECLLATFYVVSRIEEDG